MSFVFAEPQYLSAAATDLASIGSTIDTAGSAAALATTGVIPAGLDEVSAGIAALFGAHGQAYQELSARAALFHDEFVRVLSAGADAYASSEVANAQAVLAAGPGGLFEQVGRVQAGFTANLVSGELAFNQALVANEAAVIDAVGGANSLVGGVIYGGFNATNLVVGTGQQFVNTLVGAQIPASLSTSLLLGGQVPGAQIGAGLSGVVQTGQSLAGSFNAALSGMGTQLSAALSGSLSAGLPDLSSLGAQLGAGLSGDLSAGLPSVSGLVQTGQVLAGSFNDAVGGLGSRVAGVLSGAVGGELPDLSGLVQAGAVLMGGVGTALSGLGAQLSAALSGSLGTAVPGLSALIQTGESLAGGFNAALGTLGTQVSGMLSGGLGGGLPGLAALIQTGESLAGGFGTGLTGFMGGVDVLGNLGGELSAVGAQFNAAVAAGLTGDFSGFPVLVDTVSGLPGAVLAQLGQAQNGALAGFVDGQLAFNQSLVANEVALQQALFGTDAALNGAVNHGFNAVNLLVGTGEQAVNAVLGAPTPASFTGSLLVGGSLEGDIPTGGLPGVAHQLLLLNAALGGPALVDASWLSQFGQAQAAFNADVLSGQLAFNESLVTNEMALQQAIFGTDSALNGAVNHAFNMVNFTLGAGQQTVDALLGVPVPADFTGSLLASGSADAFGGVTTGGLLGAVEQKFLMDGAFLSVFGVPIQVTLDGRLPELIGQLTGSASGGVEVGTEVGGEIPE
ncbi:PE family protein [Mycobacterium marinum]|uniref:PE family protein n=2 Tax=Mycobacterium marinum TaxID=1781 RepID=UPI000358AEC5|nr:PE family protein [Mycobacterium marinum]EPQ77987.1 PE-PGRS family protein [Mycobacterium marinum MB2]